MLTLGALTIAVGRVVDDSIVVLENIKRHLGYGEERGAAILTAVKEVAGAVTASTLTTVAVFSPIVLVGGLVGELFAPFALTITVALAASLLVAGGLVFAALRLHRERLTFPPFWLGLAGFLVAIAAGAFAARSDRWPALDPLLAIAAIGCTFVAFSAVAVRWAPS